MTDDRVGDDDRRHGQGSKHLDHIVTVEAAVDPVLVLHDRHIDVVQCVNGRAHPTRSSRTGRRNDERILEVLAVAAPHDVHRGALGHEPGGERGRERRDSALGGRERGQDPDRRRVGAANAGHEWTTDHVELQTSAQSRRRACGGRRVETDRPAQARRLFQENVQLTLSGSIDGPEVAWAHTYSDESPRSTSGAPSLCR